jgi:hypothetical protein
VVGAEALFCLTQMTPQVQLCFDISNGGLNTYLNPGTAMLLKQTTFDPVGEAHMRFRQSGGDVIWETSSDGASWSLFDQRPSPIDLTQIRIDLGGGTFMNLPSPGVARFDDLIVE